MKFTYDDLSDGQKNAFNIIIDAIENKKHVTLSGGPGTGKTTLAGVIFDHLDKAGINGVVMTAPTHQAKIELSKASGMEASTLHSVLKINPDTYEENLLFEQKKTPDLSKCRVLNIDEVSMIDDQLFDITMKSIPSYVSILAMGDKDQIRPVSDSMTGKRTISKFFTDPSFIQVQLTEIMRQSEDNPIIKVSRDIVDGKGFSEMIHGDLGVYQHARPNDLLKKYLGIVKKPDDLLRNRLLAYTNNSVESFNGILRKYIYHTEKPFILDEIVVMQEPLVTEVWVDGKRFVEVILNNGEYVRIKGIKQLTRKFTATSFDYPLDINYYLLDVESEFEPTKTQISVIVGDEEKSKLDLYLARLAGHYKTLKSQGTRVNWKSFWEIKNFFQSVKALPCCTYHKSQGSTYDNAFLYTPCARAYADDDLQRQLFYVGVTRARFQAHFV